MRCGIYTLVAAMSNYIKTSIEQKNILCYLERIRHDILRSFLANSVELRYQANIDSVYDMINLMDDLHIKKLVEMSPAFFYFITPYGIAYIEDYMPQILVLV